MVCAKHLTRELINMPLLDIRNLTIEIDTPQGMVKAVDRMSLTINESEIRGLVGESGSGKSLVAKAIAGVCKDNWRVNADRMRLGDVDLLALSPRQRRKIVSPHQKTEKVHSHQKLLSDHWDCRNTRLASPRLDITVATSAPPESCPDSAQRFAKSAMI